MSLHDRLYRILLRAFQAHFRENYEDEMSRAFGELRQRDGVIAAWARSLPDLATAASGSHLRTIAQDLRYATRKILNSPGTLALIALTLGAGAGANVAVYSAVDALLFRPLPVPDAGRIVVVNRGPGLRETSSYFDYRDLRDRNVTFSQLTASFAFPALIGKGGAEERRMCGLVAGNYFQTMGIHPLMGRFNGPEDDGARGTGSVAVLSHSMWARAFASDPDAIGKTVSLNNRDFTIIDPAVDVSSSGSFQEALEQVIWPTRMAARQLSGFSALGLLLTVAGLFGLMAHNVEQRRHEAGLRMAIGATSGEVARLFLLRGARLALIGIAVGSAAALAVTRTMKGFVSGVSTSDPATYAGVAVVLFLAALLASWAPAQRAARVDPAVALRQD